MFVSSESALQVQIAPCLRDDYEDLLRIFTANRQGLAHSNTPACLVDELANREIVLFKAYKDSELVGYFPFEQKSFLGINIITPAYSELTLDFINICCIAELEDEISKLLLEWLKSLKNTVAYLFMLDENSVLVQNAIEDHAFEIQSRGFYYQLSLPKTKEVLLDSFSKSRKKTFQRQLKKFEDKMKFEVVQGKILGDELEKAIADLKTLHKLVFPDDSAMLPHFESLDKWIRKAFTDGSAFFVRSREIRTGEIVATELMMKTKNSIGLMQGGRKIEEQYLGIGSWQLNQTILWAIESGIDEFEFLFGDQEYKRKLATLKRDAVSITYFSSNRAKYTFKIKHRLGKYLKFLR